MNCLKLIVCAFGVMGMSSMVLAGPVSFTGSSYSENFDGMGTSTTSDPAGYSMGSMAGDHTTYGISNGSGGNNGPLTAAAAASAGSFETSAVAWDPSQAGSAKSNTNAYNACSVLGSLDRALGTDPTGTGGNALQLQMTNNTGGSLSSVTLGYQHKVLSLGTLQNGGTAGMADESNDLPGYSFFYSTTGSSLASDWTKVAALSLTTAGTGSATITFASPVANGGSMYFRWLDDNAYYVSPEPMNAIDNVTVSTVPEPATMTLLLLGAAGLARRRVLRRKAA